MTRWVVLAVLVVALSAGAAIVVPMLPTDTAGAHLAYPKAKTTGKPGKAVLDGEPKFNFGTMAQHQIGEHTWTIKNEGEGDLELSANAVCSCTTSDLPLPEDRAPRVLKPGETFPVRIKWETREWNQANWSRELTVYLGNDANREELKITIMGNIQPALLVYPPERVLQYSSIPSDQTVKGQFAVSSPDRPDLKIISVRTSRPESVTAIAVPMTPDDLKSAGIAEGTAYKIQLEIKPSSDLGIFSEEVIVETDHALEKELRIRVGGKRVGPVSLIPETVRMSQVSSIGGGQQSVMISVRNTTGTAFEVVETPENVEAKITPVDSKAGTSGKIRQYLMTVTVPPGTPAGIVGGTITLKTDHPDARQIKIPVDITVKSD